MLRTSVWGHNLIQKKPRTRPRTDPGPSPGHYHPPICELESSLGSSPLRTFPKCRFRVCFLRFHKIFQVWSGCRSMEGISCLLFHNKFICNFVCHLKYMTSDGSWPMFRFISAMTKTRPSRTSRTLLDQVRGPTFRLLPYNK